MAKTDRRRRLPPTSIRFTQEEHDALAREAAAFGMRISSFIRLRLFSQPVSDRLSLEVQLVSAVRRVVREEET